MERSLTDDEINQLQVSSIIVVYTFYNVNLWLANVFSHDIITYIQDQVRQEVQTKLNVTLR